MGKINGLLSCLDDQYDAATHLEKSSHHCQGDCFLFAEEGLLQIFEQQGHNSRLNDDSHSRIESKQIHVIIEWVVPSVLTAAVLIEVDYKDNLGDYVANEDAQAQQLSLSSPNI